MNTVSLKIKGALGHGTLEDKILILDVELDLYLLLVQNITRNITVVTIDI